MTEKPYNQFAQSGVYTHIPSKTLTYFKFLNDFEALMISFSNKRNTIYPTEFITKSFYKPASIDDLNNDQKAFLFQSLLEFNN
jgi:hypothetical protein